MTTKLHPFALLDTSRFENRTKKNRHDVHSFNISTNVLK